MSGEEGEFGFSKLNEGNYASWVLDMQALLLRKDLWEYVSGEITRPGEKDRELAEWKLKAGRAAGYIYAMLDDLRRSLIVDKFLQRDANGMWKKLESQFVQKKPSSRFLAYESLLSASL